MKNGIGTAIVLVSILSCSVFTGCSPGSTYITLDARSALMQPTFCLYADRFFQEQLDVEAIIVQKAQRSVYDGKGWEQDPGEVYLPQGDYLPWVNMINVNPEIVWHLQFKSADSLFYYWMEWLFGWRPRSLIRCLTYGEVPSGYQEIVKAVPLEPEQLYFVWMQAYNSVRTSDYLLRFVIRLDASGTPARLEHIQREYIFDYTPYSLRLY